MPISTDRLALLAEVERLRALAENPATTAMWLQAPASLRRDFSLGYVGAGDFWNGLIQWLRGAA